MALPVDERRQRFGQKHLHDDLHGGRPHGLRRFNDAAVHFEQGGFHKPGHEGRGGDDQRDDRGVVADGRPHEQAGQGNDRDHEDKKWERAGQVHNDIKHGVDHGPGRDAVLTGR